MAPGRRGRPPGSSNSNPRAAQGTLAFGRNNKITKPSLPPSSSTKTSKPSSEEQVKDVAQIVDEGFSTEQGKEVEEDDDIKPAETVDEDPTLREGRATAMAIREAQKMETKEMDPMVEKAKKIPEAAVKRYWREREGERKAPRVHQHHLSLHEKILRHFDLSSQYGPCVGIPRVRRWKRAEGLGLQPPIEVLAVLVKGEGKDKAFMDGLLGGSGVVG